MGRQKKVDKNNLQTIFTPALTPEARQQQMVALATDRAEQQLRDGTASPSVIVHYLKLGTANAELEKTKLEKEVALLEAKAKAYESAEDIKELYSNALNAMSLYGGHINSNDDDED